MRKVTSLGIGFMIGATLGVVLVLVFAPATGEKLRRYLQDGYRDTLADARAAAAARRQEMEADLARRIKG